MKCVVIRVFRVQLTVRDHYRPYERPKFGFSMTVLGTRTARCGGGVHKILALGNKNKREVLFCISLAYSYLCRRKRIMNHEVYQLECERAESL